MIAFLSSNLFMLPELPSVSRTRDRRRFASYEDSADRAGHCPKELNRWIGRWENEGGATAHAAEAETNLKPRTSEQNFMKRTNHHHHEEMIRYGEPFFGATRRRSRGSMALSYNDRPPEVTAMNAHLRASAYDEAQLEREAGPLPSLTNGSGGARERIRSFLHLGHQYDVQARDNFTKEAVFFVLIAALSIWPLIHAVKAMAGR